MPTAHHRHVAAASTLLLTSRLLRALAAPLLLVALWAPGAGAAVYDDFDDGDDTGWTRYDPLTGAGTWSFPDGRYRVQASATPNPAVDYPARAGATRADIFTTTVVGVDVTDWDAGLNDLSISLAARFGDLGYKTSDGYVLVLKPTGTSNFQLNRVDNEFPTSLDTATVSVTHGKRYRLVLECSGSWRSLHSPGSSLISQMRRLSSSYRITLATSPSGSFACSSRKRSNFSLHSSVISRYWGSL